MKCLTLQNLALVCILVVLWTPEAQSLLEQVLIT